MAEPTDEKQRAPHLFQPGQSGNPKGRPKGARNRLGEAFLADMLADWEKNGVKAIETVRSERPQDYLKVVASILPKELNVKTDPLGDMSDEELDEKLAILSGLAEQFRAALGEPGGDDSEAPGGKGSPQRLQ